MDFFHAQDQARRSTTRLVFLFILAVIAIITGVYFAILLAFGLTNEMPMAEPFAFWRPEIFWPVAVGTVALVGIGSLYKMAVLASGGGGAVAEALGGRLVSRGSNDRLEQRLLNVVDEMAIASGVPVPTVYVLDHEAGINAFAAGTTAQNAVVAVTRGTLEKLSRDELQGVVAHEFSHVFNGDMRLNLRLIGVLHGILLIALLGRAILEGSGRSRSKNSGGGALFGLALLVVGYLGIFFGRLIKAAVSRQREYLADASAVQYTRNPAGIAGALKKIGGFNDSLVTHPKAEEASHLFFGAGIKSWFNLLATHPPIDERIHRLAPAFAAVAASASSAGEVGEGAALGFAGGATLAADPDAVRASVGNTDARHVAYAQALLQTLPESVTADLNDPRHARDVIYALLATEAEDPLASLGAVLPAEEAQRANGHVAWLRSAGAQVRLPLVELAIAALNELPADAVDEFFGRVDRLVRADGRLSLFEFVLNSLLRHALDERRPSRSRTRHEVAALRADTALLLSVLVHVGHADAQMAASAFAEATARAPLDGPWALAPRGELSLASLDKALQRLGATNFRFKGKLIEACVAAIAADGAVTVNEAELLRAVGARLDCPVPPLLPGQPVSGG